MLTQKTYKTNHAGEPRILTQAIWSSLTVSMLPITIGVGVAHANQSFPAELDISTLDGSNGFEIQGKAEYDYLGRSVSSAGDMNGDGVADFVVGADRPTGGDDGTKPGAVYVVFGGQNFGGSFDLSTLDGSNGFEILGEAAEDELGHSVSSVGDINNDQYDDLIIGAPGADSDAGAAYVVFGDQSFGATVDLSNLSSDGSDGFKIEGESASAGLGDSVSSAGDINGDGFNDFIVGAYNADSGGITGNGAAYVVFGDQSFGDTFDVTQLDGSNGFKIEGEVEGDQLGNSVSSAGDINGDGLNDLIVGAQRADSSGTTNNGAAYVVFGDQSFGPTLELSQLNSNGSDGFKIEGEAEWDGLGSSVSSVGDISGDGLDDFIVGAYGADSSGTTNNGAAYVVFGDQSFGTGFGPTFDVGSLNGANGFEIPGEANGDVFGNAVSSAGDVNGDGNADLLVGAYQSAAAYVVFGGQNFDATFKSSDFNGDSGFKISSPNFARFGFSVSSAGDIDADGITDLIVGEPNFTVPGQFDPPVSRRQFAGAAYVVDGGVTGFGESPQGSPSATSLDFGELATSGQPSSQSLTFTNSGTGALTVNQLSISGVHATDFSIVSDTCSNQTLAADASCAVEIEAQPSGAGTRQATLSIPTNSGTETVSLSVEASDPGSVSTLSATSLDFGELATSGQPSSQSLTFTNSGTGALTVNPLSISGVHATDFSIVSDTCSNQTLAAGESCAVEIEAQPSGAGTRQATLNIPTNSGTETVSLSVKASEAVSVHALRPGWWGVLVGLLGLLGLLRAHNRVNIS